MLDKVEFNLPIRTSGDSFPWDPNLSVQEINKKMNELYAEDLSAFAMSDTDHDLAEKIRDGLRFSEALKAVRKCADPASAARAICALLSKDGTNA